MLELYLVYTASYSPELLNPIEYMFGKYKKPLKRHSLLSGYNRIEVHLKSLRAVTPKMALQSA